VVLSTFNKNAFEKIQYIKEKALKHISILKNKTSKTNCILMLFEECSVLYLSPFVKFPNFKINHFAKSVVHLHECF